MASSMTLEKQQRNVDERPHEPPVVNKRKSVCEQQLNALVSPSPVKRRKVLARVSNKNKVNNKKELMIDVQKLMKWKDQRAQSSPIGCIDSER